MIVKNAKKPKQESCDFGFSQNTDLLLDYASNPSSISDMNEFPSGYSLQLPIVICLYTSMENVSLPCVACPYDCTLYPVTPLNPKI